MDLVCIVIFAFAFMGVGVWLCEGTHGDRK